jgi:flavodoxin
MRPSILVARASKRGSTEEVATFVGKRLRERGLVVDVRRAAEVEDLAYYDGVVLGGSLYFGRWHDDAASFFGGVIDPAKLRFPFNRMPASDARDWEAIGAWADEVASLVARTGVTV